MSIDSLKLQRDLAKLEARAKEAIARADTPAGATVSIDAGELWALVVKLRSLLGYP